MSKPRLLVAGPLPGRNDAVGGTKVSFAELLASFDASGTFDLQVVDTSRRVAHLSGLRRGASDCASFVRVLTQILRHARRADVVLFCASARALLYAGPPLQVAMRAAGKPFAVRAFGGNLDLVLETLPAWHRAAAERSVLAADLLLVQTRALLERFAARPNCRQHPTTRRASLRTRPRTGVARRFLFLGQLKTDKGLLLALEAIESLPEPCTLTVIGPALVDTPLERLRGCARARWLGALNPAEVARVIQEHDALLFSSTWAGEGYPGALIEALQAGLPVVASNWRALPELVEHERSGLLVPTRDARALTAAARRLTEDAELYAALSRGALVRGFELTPAHWHPRLEHWLLDLAAARPLSQVPAATLHGAARSAGTPRSRIPA
jgi:glycosyltransferase involved in cell wall biosynthesis